MAYLEASLEIQKTNYQISVGSSKEAATDT